jgi:hypothetical protein
MQRLGKHRLKAGTVEPDTELPIFLGNGPCTFPRKRIHENTVLEPLEAVVSIPSYGGRTDQVATKREVSKF